MTTRDYKNRFPVIFGLFQKRLQGDDALLRLAALRFHEAGMGAECYAESPEEFERMLAYLPSQETPVALHLRREINLLEEDGQWAVVEFASRFSGRLFGMVVHDRAEAVTLQEEYLSALRGIDKALRGHAGSPWLFVEYAAGLEAGAYATIMKELEDTRRVSACIDTGHIGLFAAREAFAELRPGEDLFSLSPGDARLPGMIEDVEKAAISALPRVLEVITALGNTRKPLHFHLHDGHPLYRMSPEGISDHMSFLGDIPLPFSYREKRSVGLMFGPYGLARIVDASLDAVGTEGASYTLEIHPGHGRVPLGGDMRLFKHWRDITNAERMNHWLAELKKNHALVAAAVRRHTEKTERKLVRTRRKHQ